jgi:hypothetical protein
VTVVVAHRMEYQEDTLFYSRDAILMVFAFIVCVECAKEPEYRCENCDKVYKQESRYNAHVAVCGAGAVTGAVAGAVTGAAVTTVSASDFSELLRQNREMIDIMRKQQETIQMLVVGLAGGGGGVK